MQPNTPIKTVSIVIPARNEQDTIGPVLDALNTSIARLPQYTFETLVVVDSMEDQTIHVAEAKGAKILINDKLRGKGNALYFGFNKASGEVIIIFDSDGSHDPADVGRFLDALEKGAGLVIGSRVMGGSTDHDVIRLFANALFTVMVSILFRTTLMDTLNGYKAFRKDVVMGYKPRTKGFDVEIEIVAKAIRKGYTVVEIPAHESRRAGGQMKSHAIRDGFHLLWACIREGSSYQVWRLFHPRAGKRAKSLSENPLKP
jgi:glycosyltransferase involved in cell wall biosynthesis